MGRRNNDFASPFTFKDAKEMANKRGMSIDELVYNSQVRWDDPRAEVSLKDAMLEYQDALLGEIGFKDGLENKFAYNGYTVLDTNLRRPAFKTYAMKHVPHIYGGGAVEVDKGFFTSPVLNKGRVASGNNNKVNLVDFNAETLEAPILPITLGLALGIVDEMKYDTIGFDAIAEKQRAIHMSYQVELDMFAFVGHRGIASDTDFSGMARGLLNLTDATLSDIQTKGDYAFIQEKRLEYMTTPQLIEVLANEYLEALNVGGFDEEFAPNKWLVYPSLLAKLSKPAHISYSGTVYQSTLAYIKQVFKDWGSAYNAPEIQIEMLPYLEDNSKVDAFNPLLMEDGTNNTGRTILYKQDPYIFRSRLALDLTPGALVFDVVNNQIRRNYLAFVGTPLFYYPKQIRYIDNGLSNQVFHSLTLDANTNGGQINGSASDVVFTIVDKGYVALHLLPKPTKASKTFLGWATTSSGTPIADYQIAITADTKLYAIFSA